MTLTIPKTGWYADIYENEKYELEYVGETIDHVTKWLDDMGVLGDTIADWSVENYDYTVEELIAGIVDKVTCYLDRETYIKDWKEGMVQDDETSIVYEKENYYHPDLCVTRYRMGEEVGGIETGVDIEIVTDIYEYDEDGNKILLAGGED